PLARRSRRSARPCEDDRERDHPDACAPDTSRREGYFVKLRPALSLLLVVACGESPPSDAPSAQGGAAGNPAVGGGGAMTGGTASGLGGAGLGGGAGGLASGSGGTAGASGGSAGGFASGGTSGTPSGGGMPTSNGGNGGGGA